MVTGTNRQMSALYAALVTLIWWPAILFTFYNYFEYAKKYVLLGFARSLGFTTSSELSLPELLFVFTKTCLPIGLAIPSIIFVISYYFQSRIFALLVLCGSLLVILINYVNLLSVANTGSLITWQYLFESAITASKQPELAQAYVSGSSILKLMIIMFSVCAIYQLTMKMRLSSLSNRFRLPVMLLVMGILGFFPALYLYAKAGSETHLRPGVEFLSSQVLTFLNLDLQGSSEFDGLGIEQATQLFQQRVEAPEAHWQDPFFGIAEGANLVLVILETGPAEVVDFLDNARFENLRALAVNGISSEQHLSTFPYTSDALFSIFSSLYPNGLRRNLFNQVGAKSILNQKDNRIGMFSALSAAGYHVEIYLPDDPLFEIDNIMFTELGASAISIAPKNELETDDLLDNVRAQTEILQGYGNIRSEDKDAFEHTLAQDTLALSLLLSDITQRGRSGQRFASVFLPLIGHAPWPNLGSASSLMQTGEDIFVMQDKWLGQIMQTLQQSGIEQDTVIVVTSDHGLRTSAELPGLKQGMLNDMSFRVPLLISAPGAEIPPQKVTYVTSHIDVAPSILSILGISDPQLYMLGSPVWNERLAKRLTYVLAGSYLGVDGYQLNGQYTMYQEMSGIASTGSSLYRLDSKAGIKTVPASEVERVREHIDFQSAFQRKLNRQLLKTTQSP